MNFVLDCSVAMTWFFSSEATQDTEALLDALSGDAKAFVAQHWRLEIANVLLGAERTKRKQAAQTIQFLGLLAQLPIESDPDTERYATSTTMALGRKHKLTSYDAAYLELSIRRGLPLATLDSDLRRAARAEAVPLLPAS
jgi:predicted nucleic acid-binding protein